MSSNAALATLVATLSAVQSDVVSLQSRADSLATTLQNLQAQQKQQADLAQAQPSQPAPPPIDLSEAISLAEHIRDTLENSASAVQDHIDTAQSADNSGNSTGSSLDTSTGTFDTSSSTAGPSVVDPTSAEQQVIGADGEAISGNGSDSNNPTPTDVPIPIDPSPTHPTDDAGGNTDGSAGAAQSTSTDTSGQ